MRTKVLRKFASLALLLLVVGILAGAGSAQPSKKDIKKAKDLVDKADKAFNQKNYRVAIDGYAQAIVLVPGNAKAHYWKGYAHYYLKEYDQSAADLSAALDKGFTPLEVYKLRWYVHYLRKDYDDAYADVKQGIKLDPANVNFLKGLAE